MSDLTGAPLGVVPERDDSVPTTTTASPTRTTYDNGMAGSGGGGESTTEQVGAVAESAKSEGAEVAREAGRQARELARTTREELRQQAGEQQRKVAEGISSLEQELRSMARSAENPGIGADLADQAADRLGSMAGWLEQREPGQLLDEVRGFASRRPGTFLALAAGIGLVAGRVTRGIASGDEQSSGATAYPDRSMQLDLRDTPDSAGESMSPTTPRNDLGSEWAAAAPSATEPGFIRGEI